MYCILSQMELAALPCCPAEHRFSRSLQSGMVVRHDKLHTPHAAFQKAFQKSTPVHLGLRQGTGDTQHPAALIRSYADRRKDGHIPDDAIEACFFIAGIDDQVAYLSQRPVAPC